MRFRKLRILKRDISISKVLNEIKTFGYGLWGKISILKRNEAFQLTNALNPNNSLLKYLRFDIISPYLFRPAKKNEIIQAADPFPFLIEGPDAMNSSLSPILRQTEKIFLCAGPLSSVNLYWCGTWNKRVKISNKLSSSTGKFKLRQGNFFLTHKLNMSIGATQKIILAGRNYPPLEGTCT